MIDHISTCQSLSYDIYGLEILWDYCLENNIIAPMELHVTWRIGNHLGRSYIGRSYNSPNEYLASSYSKVTPPLYQTIGTGWCSFSGNWPSSNNEVNLHKVRSYSLSDPSVDAFIETFSV